VIALLLDATERLLVQLAYSALVLVLVLAIHAAFPHSCKLRDRTFDHLERLTRLIRRRP
jgi:hypothetical protein